jgi:hypothetical protein
MSRSTFRARVVSLWAQLKLRLVTEAPDPQPSAEPGVWDRPLSGDNWIGVFLIGLSVLAFVVGLQHA